MPALLDLFCGAGGAAKGYEYAGFDDIVGVDHLRQSRYPYRFVGANAVEFMKDYLAGKTPFKFDAIHASPPCQAYSSLRYSTVSHIYPDLVGPIRELLQESGLPYVIENLETAPLRYPVVLCGTMFTEGVKNRAGKLRVIRHRGFESNVLLQPIQHPPLPHPVVHTFDKRRRQHGTTDPWVDFVTVAGGGTGEIGAIADAMAIDWMVRRELNEAIPPPYTEYIGKQLIKEMHVTGRN